MRASASEAGGSGIRRSFEAEAVGAAAARALRDGASGQAAAIFERSFYVTLGGQWICVVPKSGGLGPLNVECREASLAGAIKSLRAGDRVAVENKSLRVGSALALSLESAKEWRPAPPGDWNRDSVERGLASLREAIGAREPPREGLAALLVDSAQLNAVADAARAPILDLRSMLWETTAGKSGALDATKLLPLIGLGPGLTPSGDDAIGGALIALHLLGEDDVRDLLWEKIAPHARMATGDISFAHLSAAAEGFGHEAVHRLINDVMEGGADLPPALDAVHAIGHTSGWDAVVGVVTVLDAWLEA
ncbi:MAG TPA: DUF2877 domain-containing protein [Xanthobacteraceae bacterium]|nr:DUF2877 domain-containing protein [Xanthobacteraceae bacterium]